ncbi:MAG: 4-(cytidine 5'-diphospho)-2-C-methyl-D-erythritol kinase [Ruminococcaceae bacterium]|nr:4-(cytidine 5'-diphospho)-2-C-methyl-D-erythritol kinase [Oscillospiraceae bacterium]
MTTLFEPAYAKVNLTLDILGVRPDGYHELQTVMQSILLQDDMEIIVGTGEPWKLTCSQPGIPCDGRNLAWKAAKTFCETLDLDPRGLEIRMTKRIPSEAGMGGGSSDAAAVLRALNRHFGEPLSVMELADLGARVGSDVPFCVLGGTAMCEGRGEKLRKLPDMPECYLVVVKPEFSVSTPALFRQIDSVEIYDHPDNRAMEAALESGDLQQVCGCIYNVFDPVVSAEHPELDHIKSIFRAHGALGSQMTGSGSACFAVVRELERAQAMADALKAHDYQVFIAKPV